MKFKVLALILGFTMSVPAFSEKAEQLPDVVMTINSDADFSFTPDHLDNCYANSSCHGGGGDGTTVRLHGEFDKPPGELVLDDGHPIDYSRYVNTSKGRESKVSYTFYTQHEEDSVHCVLEIIMDADTSKLISARWTTNKSSQSNPASAPRTCSVKTQGQNILVTIAKLASNK